jgi:hypothetical protein
MRTPDAFPTAKRLKRTNRSLLGYDRAAEMRHDDEARIPVSIENYRASVKAGVPGAGRSKSEPKGACPLPPATGSEGQSFDPQEFRALLQFLWQRPEGTANVLQTAEWLHLCRRTIFARLKLPPEHPKALIAPPRRPLRVTYASIYRYLSRLAEETGWSELLPETDRAGGATCEG